MISKKEKDTLEGEIDNLKTYKEKLISPMNNMILEYDKLKDNYERLHEKYENFNNLVNSLKEDVKTGRKELNDQKAESDSMKNQLKSAIDELKEKLNTLRKDKVKLKEQVEELNKKHAQRSLMLEPKLIIKFEQVEEKKKTAGFSLGEFKPDMLDAIFQGIKNEASSSKKCVSFVNLFSTSKDFKIGLKAVFDTKYEVIYVKNGEQIFDEDIMGLISKINKSSEIKRSLILNIKMNKDMKAEIKKYNEENPKLSITLES